MARVDHLVIADMVPHGAKVLDVGCSDGALLQLLARDKNAKGRGLEISQDGVNACVAGTGGDGVDVAGVGVLHGAAVDEDDAV